MCYNVPNLFDAPVARQRRVTFVCGSDRDFWLSYQEHTVDALASEGDEGRGYLR